MSEPRSVADAYFDSLGAAARRVADGEWGVSIEDVAGWPLHVGVRLADGFIRAQAEVVGRDQISDHELLFRNRSLRVVRFAHTGAGDVWVVGDLPAAAVSAAALDRLLGLLVAAATDVRQRAGAPPFVPGDFEPPLELKADGFLLEPLGPEHNESDHEAWSSSIEHIRATPGFRDSSWPHDMSLEENRADLERHARDFAARSGFTYTVLDPSDRGVIGCVYIYPDKKGNADAAVSSWVRATHAERDAALRELVSRWLAEAWPFARVSYARA